MKKTKVICAACIAACIAVIALSARIYKVNQDVSLPPVKEWQIGEWVPMEDNYFMEEYEICNGYEIRVDGAEVLTCDEFLRKYNRDMETVLQDGALLPDMVYDISVTIRNTNRQETDCGLDLSNNALYASDFVLSINPELYEIANAENNIATLMFRLQPMSELEFHLPYGIAISAKSAYLKEDAVKERDMYLLLSLYPVQNQVVIHKR